MVYILYIMLGLSWIVLALFLRKYYKLKSTVEKKCRGDLIATDEGYLYVVLNDQNTRQEMVKDKYVVFNMVVEKSQEKHSV